MNFIAVPINAIGRRRYGELLTLLPLLLAGCSNAINTAKPDCIFGNLRFDANFPAGRISACGREDDGGYSLGMAPENIPINHSPWYAFRVTSERRQTIEVTMRYETHVHRYRPKISRDKETWALLAPATYESLDGGKAIKLKLDVGPEPLYVTAQEIIDNRRYNRWTDSLDRLPYVRKALLGTSVQNRPIDKLTVRGKSEDWVLIVGRQHPPEIPGALALFSFVETLLANTRLAKDFRQRYNLLIVPNLNPDGVAAGHWRHNMNGVDLNRDWGPFTQPETRQVRETLDRLLADGRQRLILGLDFHATDKNIFYTQEDDSLPILANFTRDWLDRIQRRVPEFQVNRKSAHNSGKPVFKQYISETYGIPAITYETGDRTDRKLIARVSETAAAEMMQLLLENR